MISRRLWAVAVLLAAVVAARVPWTRASDAAARAAPHPAPAAPAPALVPVWVLPSTQRVWDNYTAHAGSSESVSLEAARGETESAHIAFAPPSTSHLTTPLGAQGSDSAAPHMWRVCVSLAPLGPQQPHETTHGEQAAQAALPTLAWWRVLAVACNESDLYHLPGGWYPDVLLPVGPNGSPNGSPDESLDGAGDGCFTVAGGLTHALRVDARVPADTPPGAFWGSVSLSFTPASAPVVVPSPPVAAAGAGDRAPALAPLAVVVPVQLFVWSAVVPDLRHGALLTSFEFWYDKDKDGATNVSAYYDTRTLSPDMKARYFGALCDARTPPDDCYTQALRPGDDYALLTNASLCRGGASRFGALDVVYATNASGKQLHYSEADLARAVAVARPVVAWLRAHGLTEAGRSYFYGFDEASPAYAGAIAQLFGALKAAYPDVRTMATLRWTPPPTAPIDTWVNLYSRWNDTAADAWRGGSPANGSAFARETWAYHCISPRPSPPERRYEPGAGWLNTFVEYPLVASRFLPWWAALHEGVRGWLYYLTDGWSELNGHVPVGALPADAALLPLSRTRFSPVRPNGVLKAFSNGDGILLYPGAGGPLPSLRLAAWRDGVEDYELLAQVRARNATLARQLVRGAVASGTSYVVAEPAASSAIAAMRRAALSFLSASASASSASSSASPVPALREA